MTGNATKSPKPRGAGKHKVPKGKGATTRLVRRAASSDMAQASPPKARPARNPRTAGRAPVSISSTQAKNAFAQLIQKARRGPVFVTNHNRREAVVLSADDYEQLLANQRDPLVDMAEHFDALVAKMQTSGHADAVDALFEATAEQLGEAAVKAAKAG